MLAKLESETLTGRNCVRDRGVGDRTQFNIYEMIVVLKCEIDSAGSCEYVIEVSGSMKGGEHFH
jgi:hypothetical protein